MNSIALFGATGATGSIFLEKALTAGFKVKALVRNPAKCNLKHPQLTILKGDVLNQADVQRTVEDTEAVVSLFGHVKGSPEWLQTKGTKNIVQAMQELPISRLISLSGGGLPFPEKDEPKFADKVIRTVMKIAVPKVLNDAIEHHKVLEKSNLNWTIVRGPRLTNEPEKGAYREGWVGVNGSTKIGRADLAEFILNVLKNNTYQQQMPFVSY